MKGKHKGNRNLYIDQRDRELYRAFCRAKKQLLDNFGCISLPDAIEITRHTQTSRYFVSEQRASDVIKLMQRQCADECDFSNLMMLPVFSTMRYQARRMYINLYIEYLCMKKEYPEESHEEIITRACSQPAPEFFISQKSAVDLLNHIHNNKMRYGIISSDQSLIRKHRKENK